MAFSRPLRTRSHKRRGVAMAALTCAAVIRLVAAIAQTSSREPRKRTDIEVPAGRRVTLEIPPQEQATGDGPPGNVVMWRAMSHLTDFEFGLSRSAEYVGN